MRVQFSPRVFCKNLIIKCLGESNAKRARLEKLKCDVFCSKGDEIQALKAKLEYFRQAKIFRQKNMKKLPMGKRDRSLDEKCLKNIRKRIWTLEKKLKELELEKLVAQKAAKLERGQNKLNLPN